MKQNEYQKAIVKRLTQSSSGSSTAAASNSYFNVNQLNGFALKLYYLVSGFMEGIASINATLCKATIDGVVYYALILQDTLSAAIPNVFLGTYYTQKLAEQYSTLTT